MTTLEPAPLTAFSGVPPALQEILPKWFLDRPAFTELAYATAKSAVFGGLILVAQHFGNTWVGAGAAAVIAGWRGIEAHQKASIAIVPTKGP
jgi:hypothetical protein